MRLIRRGQDPDPTTGFLYVSLKRTDELLAKLTKSLENDPEASNVLYLRGKILEEKV